MMIQSKEDYEYYLEADRIALGEKRERPHLISIWESDVIWKFQRLLRKAEYLHNCKSSGPYKIYYKWIQYRLFRAQIRLEKTVAFIHLQRLELMVGVER